MKKSRKSCKGRWKCEWQVNMVIPNPSAGLSCKKPTCKKPTGIYP